MKTIAYTALHYGKDYLGYAIKSVIDYVDEYYILYSPVGSHGHRTDKPCPDTQNDLYWIAKQVAGNKLRWLEGNWEFEGQQRDAIYEAAPTADAILVLDADEIWPQPLVKIAMEVAQLQWSMYYRIPIIHYWRSFHRCVLHDPAFPIRLICMHGNKDCQTFGQEEGFINHMGYAQRPAIVQYKQLTHGHRNEWRTDCDWFQDKFMANAQTDCHPVGSEYWNPEAVNPWDYMPDFMRSHPYWGMEVIE